MDGMGSRARAALDGRLRLVVAALAVLALVGAGVTYTAYATAETTTEPRTSVTAEYTGAFSHGATVTAESPLFEAGERLANRTVYFSELTPVLNGTFTFQYADGTGGDLSASADLSLVVAAVDEGDERTETYWREVRPLETANTTLSPGEGLSLSFSQNVTRLANETERLDESVGGTPGTVRLSVVATVDIEGQAGGQPVDRTTQYELGLEPDGGVYRVADPGTVVNQSRHTRTVTSSVAPGALRAVGGPLLLVAGLVGLVGLRAARHTGRLELTAAERAYLDYQDARTEYDEWITTAAAPIPEDDRETVTVASLQGLVDLAIDCDRRVLADPDGGTYRVLVDDVRYRYEAPERPEASVQDDPLEPAADDEEPSAE